MSTDHFKAEEQTLGEYTELPGQTRSYATGQVLTNSKRHQIPFLTRVEETKLDNMRVQKIHKHVTTETLLLNEQQVIEKIKREIEFSINKR